MNLITNFVRPKLRAMVGKKELTDNLWETCPKMFSDASKEELISEQFVCKHCDYRLGTSKQIRTFLW